MTGPEDILITGATGAVGSAAALTCLRETSGRVRLLLRADSQIHLQQRYEKLCSFWNVSPSEFDSRVEVAAGDLSEARAWARFCRPTNFGLGA